MRHVIFNHIPDKQVWKFGRFPLTRSQVILFQRDSKVSKHQTEKNALLSFCCSTLPVVGTVSLSVFNTLQINVHIWKLYTLQECYSRNTFPWKPHFSIILRRKGLGTYSATLSRSNLNGNRRIFSRRKILTISCLKKIIRLWYSSLR